MKKTAIALLVALSLLAAIPAASALGLSRDACRVRNTDTGVTKWGLQKAVNAARRGHHLTVRGVCHGTTTIGKDLTITGIRPRRATKPKLDGDKGGTVVTIRRGRTVVLRRVTITDGSGTDADCFSVGSTCGGGIWNHGTLKLVSVTVTGNTADYAGGVINLDEIDLQPTLTLLGTSSVSGNDAEVGGGIYNYLGNLTLMGSSQISGNTANFGAGVYNDDSGELFGTVILKASSRISGNTASAEGGGVNNTGTLRLLDSSRISGNTASNGGGVYNVGTFDTSQCGPGKRVRDNVGGDCAP